jgi:hypothetical protein
MEIVGPAAAFMAAASFLGMPWVAWWIGSRRRHRIELKKLEVERERELTRRRYMELDYELRQRQITEKLFDQTVDEHADGRRGPLQAPRPSQVPPPAQGPRQAPPGARRSAG